MSPLIAAPLLAGIASVVSYTSMNVRHEQGESGFRIPQPLNVPPEETISVAWTLSYVDEKGARQPFNANGIFVRLISASGGRSSIGFAAPGAHPRGHYAAEVGVPRGGIGGLEIGIRGTTDELFPLNNDPFQSSAATAPHQPTNRVRKNRPGLPLQLRSLLSPRSVVSASFCISIGTDRAGDI